jgi:ATP-dependent Lon protease
LNRKDLEDIPDAVRQTIRFEFLETVDQALKLALEPTEINKPAGYQPEQHVYL